MKPRKTKKNTQSFHHNQIYVVKKKTLKAVGEKNSYRELRMANDRFLTETK